MTIIGTCEEQCSISPIDFYSLGHILFGFVGYLVVYVILYLWKVINPVEYSIIVTIIIGILWELLENTILLKSCKFKKHVKDSVENSQMDVLFVLIGAISAAILSYYGIDQLIIGAVYFTVTTFIAYDLCKKLTKRKKDGK